jgi:uncharacterized membrane protein (DUF106 family)
MNKFLPVLVAGLFTGVLSVSAFATDAAKATETAKVSEASSSTVKAGDVKDDKKKLKKLAPAAKKMEEKKDVAK